MLKNLLTFLTLLFVLTIPPSFAIDLGLAPAASDEPIKAKIVNDAKEPAIVSVQGESTIMEIIHETQLDFGEEYESQYIDVRDYKNITFYVIIQKTLNEPQPDVRYKLDAFFSIEASTTTYKRSDDWDEKLAGEGYQAFGNMVMRDDNPPGQPAFNFLTTGETSSRVLSTPVYGPFVRVVLKSLTQADRRKFRIVAYLSR